MPAVVARWVETKRTDWAPATERNMDRAAHVIADAFAEFAPADVTTPVCAQFLAAFADRPRTHNIYRNVLGQVLAFAAIEGLREDHNPVSNIKGKSTPGRRRIVTDAELASIKKAALLARNGTALVHMIDIALLTGQRIGDLIGLRWQDVTDEGIVVVQGKTKQRLLIEWSPALRAAIAACARELPRIGHVLKTQTGTGFRYAGIRSAWDRACAKAGVDDLHIHDLRGRAGVDSLLADGIASAQELLGHRGEAMTRAYTHGKYHRKVKPAG
jgi:integrase